jgi:uncharacterized protein (TIGR04255 family)
MAQLYNAADLMAAYRHLTNAPITEALIDICVKPSSSVQDALQLDELCTRLKDTYPDKKLQQQFKIEFFPGPPPLERKETRFVGYRLTSSNGLQVIQASPDKITFSRLRPYQTWEQLREEAQRIWTVYAEIVKPELITRIATRFINSIEIPLPIRDFSDYLTAAPSIPEKLPQGISSFYTRVVLPDPTTGAMAIVTHALESVVTPKVVPIIVDIDVFIERTFENYEKVWTTIDMLRDIKNLIFFESLTEKALEPYL